VAIYATGRSGEAEFFSYAFLLFAHILINAWIGFLLSMISFFYPDNTLGKTGKGFLLGALLVLLVGFSTCLSFTL
jgi:hypothetical protein